MCVLSRNNVAESVEWISFSGLKKVNLYIFYDGYFCFAAK